MFSLLMRAEIAILQLLNELFSVNSTGVLTANDNLNVSFSIDEHRSKLFDLQTMPELDWRKKYNRAKDARDWTYNGAKIDSNKYGQIITYAYRPLDNRYTFYTGNSKGQDYEDYLRFILSFTERKVKLARIMDLIQINMKGNHNRDFLIREYNCGFRLEAEINGNRFSYDHVY